MELITKNAESGPNFYLMTAISAIIVSLGLVTNNTAVVIGAMLIAPIFWPIVGIALSIARGSVTCFKRNVIILAKALIIAVALILLFTLIYPIKDEPGVEVLARSTPHLFDLIIALFSGLAGAFAIVWPRVSSSLAGILIATALMPAIGVMGYGVATGNWNIALGALLLFATNLVAIIFSSFVVFFFFGYRPISTPKAKSFLTKELIWTIVLLLLITLPLTYSLYNAVTLNQYEEEVENILLSNVDLLDKKDISDIDIVVEKNKIKIEAEIQTQKIIKSYDVEKIKNDIQSNVGKPVELKLVIIPIIEIGD